MAYGLLGICRAVAGTVRDEIWTWKSISRQRKFVDLIPPTIFWMIWKESNGRTLEGVDYVKDFDRIRNKWFQTLDFFILGYPLYFMEYLGDFVDILVDM